MAQLSFLYLISVNIYNPKKGGKRVLLFFVIVAIVTIHAAQLRSLKENTGLKFLPMPK